MNIKEIARQKALEIGLVDGEDFTSDGSSLLSIEKEALDKLLASISKTEGQNLMMQLKAPPDDNLDSGRGLLESIESEIGESFFSNLAKRWNAKFQFLNDSEKAYYIRRVFYMLSTKYPDLEVSYKFYEWLYQNVCDREVIYRLQKLKEPCGSEELEVALFKDIIASAGGDPDMVILDDKFGCIMQDKALPILRKVADV